MAADEDTYAWERRYERTWEDIQVGEDGALHINQSDSADWRLRRGVDIPTGVRRGILRNFLVVWDVSAAAGEVDGDLKPTRAVAVANCLIDWIKEFFGQNPISRVGILIAGRVTLAGNDTAVNAGVKLFSPMSSSPEDHIRHIREYAEGRRCEGHFSLQNALESARDLLRPQPAYATREVLMIVSSLSSCDPGDVGRAIDSMCERNVRCSVLALQAETYIYRHVTARTHGDFAVVCDMAHLAECLHAQVAAPPLVKGHKVVEHSLVHMGLPARESHAQPKVCACHDTFVSTSFPCPRCHARSCHLPSSCAVCGLVLLSSHHLARSTRHLMSLPAFEAAPAADAGTAACVACAGPVRAAQRHSFCPECRAGPYCAGCDEFLHDVLRNCPACEATRPRTAAELAARG